MTRAASDVMQSVIFSAVLDALAALKKASGGLPNQLLRDVQAIHANVTFADLPKDLQDSIVATTRSAFTQLLKEGYAVGPKSEQRSAPPIDRVPERDRERRDSGERRFVRNTPGRRGPGGGPRGGAPGGGVNRGGRPPKGSKPSE